MEEKCTKCKKKITQEEYIENGGYCNQCMDTKELEENRRIKEEKEYNSYAPTKVSCFLIPLLGFLGTIIHAEDKELSKTCLKFAVYGILTVLIIFVMIIMLQ